jgi:hypothetical protein
MAVGASPWNEASSISSSFNGHVEPSMAVSADGTTLIVWEEFDSAVGRTVLKGKILAFDGRVLVDPFMIDSTTGPGGASWRNPSVVALPDGKFVVTTEAGSSTDGRIRVNVLDHWGGLLSATQANTSVTGTPSNSEVVTMAGGGYMVVWQASGDIKGQIFNSAGAKVGAEIKVNLNGTGITKESAPTATKLNDGRVIVAWSYVKTISDPETGEVTFPGVAYRVLNADGSLAGQFDLPVNGQPIDIREISVTALPDGGYAFSWTENNLVRLQVYHPDGSVAHSFPSVGISPGGDYQSELGRVCKGVP